MSQTMKYCPSCGADMERRIPPGDNRERDVCSRDGEVFYSNPRVVVGTVTEQDGRILMCKRAIEPRKHFWTLPAGFLELRETATDAGIRETLEEACAVVEIDGLFSFVNVTHIGQIHMFYRAHMTEPGFEAGPESLEVRFMTEDEIPWSQLAFPTVFLTLSRYFEDRRSGQFQVHDVGLEKGSWKSMGLDMEPAGSPV